MNKEFILSFLANHKSELGDKFGLRRIGLFGSYAKDIATDSSDIDLVIELEKKDFFVRDELREYLKQGLNKPVDIGYLDSFRGFYREKIEKEVIYV
jgi:uncharacterized protein